MKQKMSNRTFRLIVIPIVSVLFVVFLAAAVLMGSYPDVMDMHIGRGERQTIVPDGTENWDTEYYKVNKSTFAESQAEGAKIVEKIAGEGTVLLKNNGVLPLEKQSVISPFGYCYKNFIPGGYGDSNPLPDYFVTPAEGLSKNFRINETTASVMDPSKVEKLKEAPGTTKADAGMNFPGQFNLMFATQLYEYNPSIYAGTEVSCDGTTGMVFIGRIGNEGHDSKHDAYEDGTPHGLALSANEKGTIKFAKDNCDKVVAVINSANIMELGVLMSGEYEVDAIVWVGHPGATGYTAFSDILCNNVNPSGRTPDLYPADFTKDPTYPNFGEFLWSNSTVVNPDGNHDDVPRSFIEYEEGIYIGYRYYETAAELKTIDYNEAVVFPFGYGLSYTTFEQKIENFSDVGDNITVTVSVKNTGAYDGKEVVQLYYRAPYTDLDKEYGIEKAAKNLVAFEKIEVKKGYTETVTLTFAKEDMASYCYTRNNGDGTTGCYMLEKGDYTITLGKNSHDAWDKKTTHIDSTIWYDNTNPRQSERDAQSELDENGKPKQFPAKQAVDTSAQYLASTNQFAECNAYMTAGKVTNMTRANWSNTFPTAPAGDDFVASQAVLDEVKDFDYKTDPVLGNVPGSKVYSDKMPNSKKVNGIVASTMRGKSYYDEMWDDFLDQIDYDNREQLDVLLFAGNYLTGELDELGLPGTKALDGPASLISRFQRSEFCAYTSEVVLAATWNTQLAYEMGYAITQECLTFGIQGWYAPAMNTHRTPFCGRNFEYYSEDGLLAGKMGAAAVSAAGDNGVYCEIKHLAFNEIETHRQYVSTWLTEQAAREIYLKPFEITVKEAVCKMKYISDEQGTVSTKYMRAANAIMTAQNYIGGRQCDQHFGLVTNVIRGEWGFQGFVEGDMYNSELAWQRDLMLRAGTDVWMKGQVTAAGDMTSPTIRNIIREAVHHIAYSVVNGSIMNGTPPGAIVKYTMSPWKITLIVCGIIVGVIVIAAVALIILRTLDEQKNPGKYRSDD